MAKKSSRGRKKSRKASKTKASTRRGSRSKPSKRSAGKTDTRKKSAGKKKATAGKPSRTAPKKAKSLFNRKTLKSVMEKLLQEKAGLGEQLREIEEVAFNSTQSDISGEVGYDEDYADAGSATFEREKDLSIHNNVVDLLEKVDKALRKIEEGTYGICESCGNPIEKARIKALPSALLCLNCKKREERR